jgi:hypothetical protein
VELVPQQTTRYSAMATTATDTQVTVSPHLLSVQGDLKPTSPYVVEIESILDAPEHDDGVPDVTRPHAVEDHEDTGLLIPASLITDDFDALRFQAAASLQILQPQTLLHASAAKSHHLISSPYNDPDHLLDLRTLDTQCRLLAQALTFLKPTRTDYATADYVSSFNWPEVLSTLRTLAAAEDHKWVPRSFYTVIFRSQLNHGIDLQRLHDLDKTSHREAVVSGGLLKYWFGRKDEAERNLATCKLSIPVCNARIADKEQQAYGDRRKMPDWVVWGLITRKLGWLPESCIGRSSSARGDWLSTTELRR